MMLTDQERERFAAYCEQEEREYRTLVEQLQKLPGMDAVLRLNQAKMAAYGLVARELRATESQTIRGGPTP